MAMEYQRLSMDDKVDENLSAAEDYFWLIISLDEEDAGAWNGLGSVYMLRCELDRAKEYIEKALEINPEYGAARRDLERIPDFRDFCNRWINSGYKQEGYPILDTPEFHREFSNDLDSSMYSTESIEKYVKASAQVWIALWLSAIAL